MENNTGWEAWEELYGNGAFFTGFIVFIGSWIYCISTYGYLFGVGLGWLPSLIVAIIAGAVWPLIVLGIAVYWQIFIDFLQNFLH